jgi:orotate phosphoribosyltransferase-like protein
MTRRGRPTVLGEDVLARIAELRAEGLGYGRIAQAVNIGKSTVARVLRNPAFVAPSQNPAEGEGRGRRLA